MTPLDTRPRTIRTKYTSGLLVLWRLGAEIHLGKIMPTRGIGRSLSHCRLQATPRGAYEAEESPHLGPAMARSAEEIIVSASLNEHCKMAATKRYIAIHCK